jgi:hypothetical protein
MQLSCYIFHTSYKQHMANHLRCHHELFLSLNEIFFFVILFYLQSVPVQRRMVSPGMLRRVALLRTEVSEELSASFIRMTRIGEVGTTLAVTGNRRTLRRNKRASVAS